jgi:hypothetical protein
VVLFFIIQKQQGLSKKGKVINMKQKCIYPWLKKDVMLGIKHKKERQTYTSYLQLPLM